MRLVELEPQWLCRDDTREVGVMFRCPHCVAQRLPLTWLTCFWVAMPVWGEEVDASYRWAGQMGYIRAVLDRIGRPGEPENNVVPCDPACVWIWNGEGFERMSLSPSLDASRAGHWHGYVNNGDIT